MDCNVRFIYFDLGKVLVDFDVDRMCRQMAEVVGTSPEAIHHVLYEGGLQRKYELGLVTTQEFYELFCKELGSWSDPKRLLEAACDIFSLNVPVIPLVTRLAAVRFPIGVLSNTCEAHWDYIYRRFRGVMELFPVGCASFQCHALKPESAIFHYAAELAGCKPQEIFFVDDHPPNVAGAQAMGFQAVRFCGVEALLTELEMRGIAPLL